MKLPLDMTIKKTGTSVVYILILKRLKDPDIKTSSFVLLIF